MESLYRVFLVEDSAAIRETLTQSLESAGLVRIVGHADTAEDAWQMLRQTPADAVVIDLHLRNGTGFDFLSRLRTEPHLNQLVKIVLTNYATSTFRDRCVQLGAQHFFDKSLEFDRVIDLLNTLAKAKSGGVPAA